MLLTVCVFYLMCVVPCGCDLCVADCVVNCIVGLVVILMCCVPGGWSVVCRATC